MPDRVSLAIRLDVQSDRTRIANCSLRINQNDSRVNSPRESDSSQHAEAR